MRRTLSFWLTGGLVFAAGFALAADAVSALVDVAERDGIPGPSGHLYGYPAEMAGTWLTLGLIASLALVLAGAALLAPMAWSAIPKRRRLPARPRHPRRSLGPRGRVLASL